MKMEPLRLVIILLTLLFFRPGVVVAQPIAFFPLLELSADPNGINTPLTERVRLELLAAGYKLVPADVIMAFLVRHRIRTLGKLTSYQTALLRREIGAELMLQGTILQIRDDNAPALSLDLKLSRTDDGTMIWTRSRYLDSADLISFLGRNDPGSLEDLLKPFFADLFTAMPASCENRASSFAALSIAKVIIQPRYVRPGELVSCRIQLHAPLEKGIAQPDLSITTGGSTYPLVLDSENHFLSASWPAESGAGAHFIALTAGGPAAANERGIGSYRVDTRAPGIRLNIIGTERDGEIMFSDRLLILPRLLRPEPISRWEITVIDEEEEIVVIMGDSGNMPRRLDWRGKTSLGTMAPPGLYSITFKVWDRADRESSAEATVHFLPEPPDILVEVVQKEDRITVEIDDTVDTPLNYWWAKFYSEDGSLLKLAQGTELPVSIDLDVSSETKPKIKFLLSARDILGNQSRKDIANLFQMAEANPGEEEISIETDWVKEF